MDPTPVSRGPDDTAARERVVMSRAVVSVGAVETEYLGGGRGAPVVILDPELALAAESGRIPASLRGGRVIVPLHTSVGALASPSRDGGPAFDVWWRGFVDGLGLSGVTVVVPSAFEADVRRLADASPGEIVRIIGR